MTATLLRPRDYQTECIRAIHTKWDAGTRRPASVLPTGAGKTVVFSHLAEEYLSRNPTKRVLVLSHTDELVLQAADEMRGIAPHRSVGIVKAERNEITAQVISASVQSLRSVKRRSALHGVGLIIVDECHHAVAKTYRTILDHFRAFEPDGALVAGFTATLIRSDKEKLSDIWQDVAFKRDIAFMIRRGYLLDARGHRIVVPELDLKGVKVSKGDYEKGALGEALLESFAPEIVARKYVELAKDRQGLIFAPTVEAAYAFAEAFNAEGIVTEVVHGELGRDVRRAVLARLKSGETQCVSNCAVLTEGFNNPKVSCAVIARPTKSSGLYQQMVGRVLRPDLSLAASERGHALILDVVGVSGRHDLRSLVDLSAREDLREREDLEELSLLELDEFVEDVPEVGAGRPEPETYYAGPVDVEDFDPLLRDSSRTWGRTPEGTYWISGGSSYYVFMIDSLEGEPGTYDLVWCTKDSAPGAAGMTEHRGLSFEMALSWAEEVATDKGGHGALTLTTKKAKWRKDPPNSGQLWKAKQLGIDVPMGIFYDFATDGEVERPKWNKGQVSEAIDNVQAGKRIDTLIQAALAGQR